MMALRKEAVRVEDEGRHPPEADDRMAEPDGRRIVWVGSLILVLGAWGAGVAYFGRAVGLGAPAGRSTAANVALNLLPGLATMVGGILLLRSRRTGDAALCRAGAALVTATAGWFVLGSAIFPILYGSALPAAAGTGRGRLADLASVALYSEGLGAALAVLAGVALVGLGTAVPEGAMASGVGPATIDLTEGEPEGGSRGGPDAARPARARIGAGPLAPVVSPPSVSEGGPPSTGPVWRPQFRSKISRMVARPGGHEEPDEETAPIHRPVASVPSSVVSRPESAPGAPWRPRFMPPAAPPPLRSGVSAGAEEHVPPIPSNVMQPGEWLVATFPHAHLIRRGSVGSTPAGSQPDKKRVIARGTAAVTNRRVIFDPGVGRRLREWSLDLAGQPADSGATVIDLTEGVELELTGSGARNEFAAAVHAASSARTRMS